MSLWRVALPWRGMDGLEEYSGTADGVVEFVGEAEIPVTQLAPMSRGMPGRLPRPGMIAVCRGGPVNIGMTAARDRGVPVVITPGRNASAVAEFTIGAILAETDVLVMRLRVTEQTRGVMNAAEFATMKTGSLLVNTARGPPCDCDALHGALTEAPLGGAMLEDFSVEPAPPDWPLLQLPGMTLAPRIAGASMRTATCAAEQAAEEVRHFLANEPPRHPC